MSSLSPSPLMRRLAALGVALSLSLSLFVGVADAQGRFLSFEQVREIVSRTIRGAHRFEIKLKTNLDGSRGLYEVEAYDERNVEWEFGIDAVSGDILYQYID